MTNPVPVLSDDEVAEIEAHLTRLATPDEPWESKTEKADTFKNVAARHAPALCATVRALREKYESLKSKIAWHRDGVGPDVPVLQERYDKLIAERNRLCELADEQHDLLSAEKRANDALREQLAQTEAARDQLSSALSVRDAQLAQAEQERDGRIASWDNFVTQFRERYPRLPLYDTEKCKRYVQRAVKFITHGYIDD